MVRTEWREGIGKFSRAGVFRKGYKQGLKGNVKNWRVQNQEKGARRSWQKESCEQNTAGCHRTVGSLCQSEMTLLAGMKHPFLLRL